MVFVMGGPPRSCRYFVLKSQTQAKQFLVSQQLYMSSCVFFCPIRPNTNTEKKCSSGTAVHGSVEIWPMFSSLSEEMLQESSADYGQCKGLGYNCICRGPGARVTDRTGRATETMPSSLQWVAWRGRSNLSNNQPSNQHTN